MKKQSTVSGQVVVILLMVMVVVLTLGLSIATRATTDVHLATTQEESARAFAAAEAGIEEALIAAPGATTLPQITFTGLATADVSIVQGLPAGSVFAYPDEISADQPVQLWLTDYPSLQGSYSTSTMNIYWGTPGKTNCSGERDAPALLVADVYVDGNVYKVQHTADSPCPGDTNFLPPDQTSPPALETNLGSQSYQYRKEISLHAGQTKFLRIRLLFAEGKLAVQALGGGTIPVQGQVIESVGKSGTTQRRIQLFRSYPQVPAMFDHVIFSPGDIQK